MLRIVFGLALFASTPAFACKRQDAAAYQEAAQEVHAADGTKATFTIEGLSCGDCSDKVTASLRGIEGVHAAAVDYQSGEAVVAYDAAQTSPEALLAAIQEAGFSAERKEA